MPRTSPSRMRTAGLRLLKLSLLNKEALVKAEEVGAQIRTLYQSMQQAELSPEDRAVLASQLKKLLAALATGG